MQALAPAIAIALQRGLVDCRSAQPVCRRDMIQGIGITKKAMQEILGMVQQDAKTWFTWLARTQYLYWQTPRSGLWREWRMFCNISPYYQLIWPKTLTPSFPFWSDDWNDILMNVSMAVIRLCDEFFVEKKDCQESIKHIFPIFSCRSVQEWEIS